VSNRPLAGSVILIVEDEPLLALELDRALRVAGAKVVSAGFLESGLCSTEHPQLSAAVVDLQLGDGDGTALCRRLRQLRVPFVVHTGYPLMVTERWSGATVICKPAHPDRIVAALVQLLAEDVAHH
jgi:DNA-binding response OmpR family regulator